MSTRKESDHDIKLVYLLSQPIRYAIVNLIRKNGKKYIAEISRELSVNRKVISYHLRALEKRNLITTKLTQTPPSIVNPAYVRYVELTDLTREMLDSELFSEEKIVYTGGNSEKLKKLMDTSIPI